MQIKNGPICSQHLIREAGYREMGGLGGEWLGGDVVKVIQITGTKGGISSLLTLGPRQ